MPLLPSFGEIATHTVDTSRCGVTCQWLHHLVSSSLCTQLVYTMAQLVVVKASCSYTVQSRTNTPQISIDLNLNFQFEFTIKTMNALLSERFTHHQRVASTYYSQLQQLKDCTIFPIINYFLVKYPIFPFFLYMFTSQLTTCHRIVLVTA